MTMMTVGTASHDDIVTLTQNMREADRLEALRAFPHATVEETVEFSAYVSYVLLSAKSLATGEAIALAGVAGRQGKLATAWMITTDWVYSHPVPFLRRSGQVLAEMFDRAGCDVFTNLVDDRNTLHRRWLTWLGATWDAPQDLNGHPFHRFYLERKALRHVYSSS
jgi:hypothetical protein